MEGMTSILSRPGGCESRFSFMDVCSPRVQSQRSHLAFGENLKQLYSLSNKHTRSVPEREPRLAPESDSTRQTILVTLTQCKCYICTPY